MNKLTREERFVLLRTVTAFVIQPMRYVFLMVCRLV